MLELTFTRGHWMVSRMNKEYIWLARHGAREDSENPHWFRTAERPHDPGLAELGHAQASELAARLKQEKVAHIFCSPFLRTVQTAHAVAEALNLNVKLEHGFCEWLNPAWFDKQPEFLPISELSASFPRIDKAYTTRTMPEFPETLPEVVKRAGQTMYRLRSDYPGELLVVGHGATVMGVACALDAKAPQLTCPLCSLTRLVRKKGGWHVDVADDATFLRSGATGACF